MGNPNVGAQYQSQKRNINAAYKEYSVNQPPPLTLNQLTKSPLSGANMLSPSKKNIVLIESQQNSSTKLERYTGIIAQQLIEQ